MQWFELAGLLFEYDDAKSRDNQKIHKLSFETAALAFLDPKHKTDFNRHAKDEDRWHTLGWAGPVLVYVVHTDRKTEDGKEIIHLISARKATKRERLSFVGQNPS